METTTWKTIKISLDEAREWIKGENPTLKNIARRGFSKQELGELSSLDELRAIYEELPEIGYVTGFDLNSSRKLIFHRDLLMLADFFNGSWKRTSGNTGYFIRYDYRHNSLKKDSDFIGCHHSVIYPGIVYFEKRENAIKALQILKKAGYKFD